MIVAILSIIGLAIIGLFFTRVLYQRHRTQPAVHHFSMARHMWQPDQRKL